MTDAEKLATLIGKPELKNDARLAMLIDIAEEEFIAYCRRTDVPPAARSLVLQMAVIKYNQIGSEGLASADFSGVAENWIDGYPDNLKRALNRFCLARFV